MICPHLACLLPRIPNTMYVLLLYESNNFVLVVCVHVNVVGLLYNVHVALFVLCPQSMREYPQVLNSVLM